MKKALIYGAAFAFLCATGLTGLATASDDKGPAEITLQSTVDPAEKPKPAQFPHAKHQESFSCADCHHSKAEDGTQSAYTEGMKIEKCETCHNKAAGLDEAKKLSTFKDAAHANCKGCHKEKGGDKAKELAKCTNCHPKAKG